ncbi:MAG: 3-hydroxyacyl-ACP dehydratase [Burkholderiales bacterium]
MMPTRKHCIPADHPALAGHFPGNPIVPGVTLLAVVEGDARAFLGAGVRLVGLPVAKFLAPVKPEESFTIHIAPGAELVVTFKIEKTTDSGTVTVASGSMRFVRSTAASATPASTTP